MNTFCMNKILYSIDAGNSIISVLEGGGNQSGCTVFWIFQFD